MRPLLVVFIEQEAADSAGTDGRGVETGLAVHIISQ